MRIDPTTDEVSIVLLGAFNPRIFHPSWLALHKLISSEQADDADVDIVHRDITRFTVAYRTFDIQTNRFSVRCDTTHKDVIKDLVLKTFGELLPHSPVWQLGINRIISFSCGSEAKRNEFGDLLAPKGPWGAWGKKIERTAPDSVFHGGMTRLVMQQQPRTDGLKGYIQADLRPRADDRSGVNVDINNHFMISDDEESIGCLDAMETLGSRWQDAMVTAEGIVDELMATVKALK